MPTFPIANQLPPNSPFFLRLPLNDPPHLVSGNKNHALPLTHICYRSVAIGEHAYACSVLVSLLDSYECRKCTSKTPVGGTAFIVLKSGLLDRKWPKQKPKRPQQQQN